MFQFEHENCPPPHFIDNAPKYLSPISRAFSFKNVIITSQSSLSAAKWDNPVRHPNQFNIRCFWFRKARQNIITDWNRRNWIFNERLRRTRIMKLLKLIFTFQIFTERKSDVLGYKLYEFWEDGIFPIATGGNIIFMTIRNCRVYVHDFIPFKSRQTTRSVKCQFRSTREN